MTANFVAPSGPRPRVTVVVTCRERHRLTEAALDTIVRNTRMPIRLIFADVCSPDWLRERIAARAGEWGLETVRFDEPLWPTQVRRRLAQSIDTEYAVFMDNDVLVRPGWLEKMYECAEQTGAGIVGPLYLWGGDAQADRIHMAGGDLAAEPVAGGVVLKERHRCYNLRLGETELRREECGFVEFHCLLMRREVFRAPETFDENIVCVHEHIHASLIAHAMGLKTYLEPEAQVAYLASVPYALADLQVFRRRWSHEAGESSLRAFSKRWGVVDNEQSFGDVRSFLRRHRAEVDPLRPSLQDETAARTPMRESDLKQSPAGLIERARAKGYTAGDLQRIVQAHWTALVLSNGGYRPCGRPFIDHLTGTASVLVHYGFETRLVEAALLHAAYTHAPRFFGDARATVDAVAEKLGGTGSALESDVRAYTLRAAHWKTLAERGDWRDVATMTDTGTAIVAMANAADMNLSGETRATGRRDEDDATALSKARDICRLLGVPGLAESALARLDGGEAAFSPKEGRAIASFRIEGTNLVPMVNPAFFQVLASSGGREPAAIASGT